MDNSNHLKMDVFPENEGGFSSYIAMLYSFSGGRGGTSKKKKKLPSRPKLRATYFPPAKMSKLTRQNLGRFPGFESRENLLVVVPFVQSQDQLKCSEGRLGNKAAITDQMRQA